MNTVEFLNRRVGWAAGQSARGKTALFRTRDGGQTWERIPLFDHMDHPPDFLRIRFWDANHGWIASYSQLLYTSDGGESWIPVEVPNTTYVFISRVLPLGPAGVAIGRNKGWVRITTDGGRTWLETRLADDAGDVTGLAFVPPQTLFAVTSASYGRRGSLYRSDDGGQSWEQVLGASTALGDIAFAADGLHGVIVGSGVAFWTDDGGATWKKALFAGTGSAARFLDDSTVVASSSYEPTVLISRNGGKTWLPGPPAAGSSRLYDIAPVDGGCWFASGSYDPAVYHYADPDYVAPIAEETLELSQPVESAEGTPLPPGTYLAELAHVGLADRLALTLLEPADGIEIGVQTETGELGPNQYACEPCTSVFPVILDYELAELDAEQTLDSLLNFSLEANGEGIQLSLEAPVPPLYYHASAADLLGGFDAAALNADASAGSVSADLTFDPGLPAVYRVRLDLLLQSLAKSRNR